MSMDQGVIHRDLLSVDQSETLETIDGKHLKWKNFENNLRIEEKQSMNDNAKKLAVNNFKYWKIREKNQTLQTVVMCLPHSKK